MDKKVIIAIVVIVVLILIGLFIFNSQPSDEDLNLRPADVQDEASYSSLESDDEVFTEIDEAVNQLG
jgi:uncharacterized protein YxeA